MKKSSREEVASYTTIVNTAINLRMSQSSLITCKTVTDIYVLCCKRTRFSQQAILCDDVHCKNDVS